MVSPANDLTNLSSLLDGIPQVCAQRLRHEAQRIEKIAFSRSVQPTRSVKGPSVTSHSRMLL
jgi:hypothetical protein